jgi:hypothetical protein
MVGFLLMVMMNVWVQGTASTSVAAHDFHLSRSEINYETKSGELQISAHIFIDDLEDAIALSGQKGLYLCTDREHPDGEKAMEKYINSRLTLKVKDKKVHLVLLGKETSKDKMAVWCYLEVTGIKNLRELMIDNKILTELFNDQKNIVDFTVDKKKKHFSIFDAKKTEELYTW